MDKKLKLRKGGGKGMSGDALVGNVRQSTINDIKKMGMTAALKLAGTNGSTAGGVAREFQEGVRRMYGANRLAAAKAKYAPKAATPGKSPYGFSGMPGKAGKPTTGARTVARPAANKATAAQVATASARAGVKVTPMTPSRPKSKVASDKKAIAARRAAAAAAVKKAGGRTA